MLPAQKAAQLMLQYVPIVKYKYQAKHCALVGIEESLKLISAGATKEYLEAVKFEIEKTN